jgi:molecular chaperone DnaK
VSNAKGKLVGIDLGTTMSVISYLDANGVAQTLANKQGEPLTPSAIYLDGTNAVVGRDARSAAAYTPEKVAMFVKRYMGKPIYPRPVDGRQLRPETLSAIILRKLKRDAERRIGPISRAVITVPAFFDDARRKATQDAGRIAGLDVIDILNGPTAAALAYSLNNQLRKDPNAPAIDLPDGQLTALVYDLGGGTFDVTVVRLAARRFDTVATDGAVQLGGKDWDDRIVALIGEEFSKKHGFNPAAPPKDPADPRQKDYHDFTMSIAHRAELAKQLLSSLPSAPVECSFRDHSLNLSLTRAEFEKRTSPLLLATETVTKLVVEEQAQMTWANIDRVLLVGGSTRMPMVPRMLRTLTGKVPDDTLDPDQVVAHGAAIFAAIRTAKAAEGELVVDDDVREMLRNVVVEDVNAHSLGVEVFSKANNRQESAVLIKKNSQLPFAGSKVFRLREAGASRVLVKVLEGEAVEASANIPLGECIVHDLPPGLAQGAPIQVRLSYDTSGRVHVMALDMTGGNLAQAEIHRRAGLTDDDVQREAAFVNSLDIQ